ncbi:recombinase family protein [Henriciella algicola]|uniref:Recombinase family protein n=1 Tax=Henriciella algicola TaxID=1608422 RepID=A0A399RAI3_9PROT|nr:recombinase family protein [Henriciella algicola]RIJ27783.1 recombinase family protein [Henriciella algicola]
MKKVRCAIYTRKSSDEGLGQAFNSLHAQRDACEAYIRSQRHEGWKLMPQHYDDGGISGGTMDRPALQALIAEIEAGRIDMVVVYKIDRLTRSLADFARLVERFDATGASFVSVTQQFNTASSMGRLTLNVLLSFAQFEREVTAERIRDKIAASKKKGMWMGGVLPLGYDKADGGLVINRAEAETVRTLFEKYAVLGSVRKLKDFADRADLRTKQHVFASGRVAGGKLFTTGHLYQLLSNTLYRGKIKHRDQVYQGLHDAIISEAHWSRVQEKLANNRVARTTRKNAASPSPLAGKVFGGDGRSFYAHHARKGQRRYRYYVSADDQVRLPARELEQAAYNALMHRADVRQQTADGDPAQHDMLQQIDRLVVGSAELEILLAGEEDAHPMRVPFTQRRRGVERKLVLQNADVSRKVDQALIRRVVKAMDWLDAIKAGRAISDIAAEQNVSPSYITHNLDLAFLSPRILEAVSEGRQAPHISAYQLSKISIPVNWDEQDPIFLS